MNESVNKIFFLIIFLGTLFISCSKNKDDDYDKENLNKEILNAKITEFKAFYFVGNYSGIPSIFKYDYVNNTYKIFWHSNDERVMDLLISPDYKSGYFISKRKQRLKSSQPAIEKGRLYRIDFELNKAELITQLDDGIQVIPFWFDNDRFTLVINSIDKTIASYVNKNIQVYNRFGKLLSDNTEIFDLTKDGYPITKLPSLNFKSLNGLFEVTEKKDSIYIRQQKSQKEIKTKFKSKKILQLTWAENNRQLIILFKSDDVLTKNPTVIKQSILAIYDLQLQKTVKTFSISENNHFVLIGDFLIFDKGFGRDSYIEIFKLATLSDFKIIKINGGCGLRNF